jgi:hypothetical protein
VDADDDGLRRFIVQHYRYDTERHERRHVIVAAFDNEREYKACMTEAEAQLRHRRESGEDVDPQEYISGVVHQPGHRRLQQNARTIQRAMRHGHLPDESRNLELPSNFAILGAGRLHTRWSRIVRWLRRRR